jgi:hypothetical protein
MKPWRHPFFVAALFLGAGCLMALTPLACNGDGNKEVTKPPENQADTPEPEPGLRHGEIREDAPAASGRKTASTCTPNERKRLKALIDAIHLAIRIHDEMEFAKAFLEFSAYRNFFVKARGPEAWEALPENQGRDEIDRTKAYKARIQAFFNKLKDRSEVSDLTLKELRDTVETELLFADTCSTDLDKHMLVIVAGFVKGDEVRAILRLRIANFRNRLRIFIMGDERIYAPRSCSEEGAVKTLRSIHALQAAFLRSRRSDRDRDGQGEFAFLDELMGGLEIRGTTERAPRPDLARPLREVSDPNGMIVYRGYILRLYLPGQIGAVAADDSDGGEPASLTDQREARWCAYAWPLSRRFVGSRTLVIGPSGKVYASEGLQGHGIDGSPKAGAAFAKGTKIGERVAAEDGREAMEGGTWTEVK